MRPGPAYPPTVSSHPSFPLSVIPDSCYRGSIFAPSVILDVDVIVTDQTMPDCTGEMLAQEMLAIRLNIPIILCTGFSYVMTEEKALSIGVRAFLLKPFSTKDLAQTIQRVLARDTDQKKEQPLKSNQA